MASWPLLKARIISPPTKYEEDLLNERSARRSELEANNINCGCWHYEN
jgi:hypothetical protein